MCVCVCLTLMCVCDAEEVCMMLRYLPMSLFGWCCLFVHVILSGGVSPGCCDLSNVWNVDGMG